MPVVQFRFSRRPSFRLPNWQQVVPTHYPNYPERSTNARGEPLPRVEERLVNLGEIGTMSSALKGVTIREVTVAEVNPSELTEFVQRIRDANGEEDNEDESDEDTSSVMAGEHARQFSELQHDSNDEDGPACRGQKQNSPEVVMEATTRKKKQKAAVLRSAQKLISLMAGSAKFDFVGAFRDAPVVGLNWASFWTSHLRFRKISITYLCRNE